MDVGVWTLKVVPTQETSCAGGTTTEDCCGMDIVCRNFVERVKTVVLPFLAEKTVQDSGLCICCTGSVFLTSVAFF